MSEVALYYGAVQIGVAPRGWGNVKVDGNLVEVLGGFSCARTQTVSSGVAHLRPMNISTSGEVVMTADTQYVRPDYRPDLANYHLQPGDILFNNTNSVELVGKTAVVREPMAVAFSNHINRLRVRDVSRIEPRWLALALRNLQEQGVFAAHCNRWIGQAGFSVSGLAIMDIPIPYPDDPAHSLAEQRRIVARLEARLGEVRELRKLQAEIEADVGRLMQAQRHEIFSQLMHRYTTEKFAEIADSRLGKMLSQASKTDTDSRPYLRNANVLWDEFSLGDVLEMDFSAAERIEFRLRPGDLLICEGGEIGRCAVWEGQIEECYFQKALHRARLRDHASSPRYLMHFLAWAVTSGAIAELRTGSAIPHLTGVRLKTLEVIWPEPSVQHEVVDELDRIQAELSDMQKISAETVAMAKQIEQSMLAQVFMGGL